MMDHNNISRASYSGKSAKSTHPDDDEIVSTTITFDVNLDSNGQVISTTEGQVVHEENNLNQTINSSLNGTRLSEQSRNSYRQAPQQHNSSNIPESERDLNQNESEYEESTKSLIEKSKKYLNDEAGIIILRKDDSPNTTRNFNINLDFDIKDPNALVSGELNENDSNEQRNFNINLDFDLKNGQLTNQPVLRTESTRSKKSGVDIDLMITRNSTRQEFETQDDIIDEVYEEIVQPNQNNGIDDQNARYEFIERLVDKALGRSTLTEQNEFYERNVPKAQSFSLKDCIEKVLEQDSEETKGDKKYPVLRSFETLDIEALTRGFESEEINEQGKLVLYITEKQLLQLLNQRAIIIPNKQEILASNELREKKLSLVDDNVGSRIGNESPIREVELVVDQQQDDNNVEQNELTQEIVEIQNEYKEVEEEEITEQAEHLDEEIIEAEHQEEELQETEISDEVKEVELVIDQDNYKAIQSETTREGDDSYESMTLFKDTSIIHASDSPRATTLEEQLTIQNSVYDLESRIDTTKSTAESVTTVKVSRSGSSIEQTTVLSPTEEGDEGEDGKDKISDESESDDNKKLINAKVGSDDEDRKKKKSKECDSDSDSDDCIKKKRNCKDGRDGKDGKDGKSSKSDLEKKVGDVIKEFERFLESLRRHLDQNKNEIDWDKVRDEYSSPDQQEKAKKMKKFTDCKNNSPDTIEDEALKQLDDFINKIIKDKLANQDLNRLRAPQGTPLSDDSNALELIDNLIDELKKILNNWNGNKIADELQKITQDKTRHKIIIKTIRKIPTKVWITGNCCSKSQSQFKQQQTTRNKCQSTSTSGMVKKRITYAYLEDYNPSTRIYEILDSVNGPSECSKMPRVNDLFNSRSNLRCGASGQARGGEGQGKPFDKYIQESFGKPTLDKINKYIADVQQGLKPNIRQLYPDGYSNLKLLDGDEHGKAFKGKERVEIESSSYPKYISEISKNFQGLNVTDFPIYVQEYNSVKKSQNHPVLLTKDKNAKPSRKYKH